ncbi:16S rRNA (cytosine(1402)-N(4))-methyltransferase RsmH [Chlamydiota bacterium]
MTQIHIPVMAQEVLEGLSLNPGEIVVDCTVGLGGHAQHFLDATEPNGKVIGIDKDEDAVEIARGRLEKFRNRCICVKEDYKEIKSVLQKLGIKRAHGVFFDLGLSFLQIDTASRGFSFMKDGPLDMRMDRETTLTAYKVVNEFKEEQLCELIRVFGEEPFAEKIARNIILERKNSPILSTGSLARLVIKSIGYQKKRSKINPATRTFQAIRIYINKELESLKEALPQAIDVLFPKGKIAVISFHSLEDRIVKETFKKYAKGCTCPSDFPECICGKTSQLKIITEKPLSPTDNEIDINPHSRSAKLRIAEKL